MGEEGQRPLTENGSAIVIAVDDALFEQAATFPTEVEGVPVVVKRASEFRDSDREADLHFGAYAASTPTCRKVLSFVQNGGVSLIEQDEADGAIYRDGAQVWPSAPASVWSDSGAADRLVAGVDGALLFVEGKRVRITTLPDVMVVYEPATTRALRPGEVIPSDWVAYAQRMLGTQAPR